MSTPTPNLVYTQGSGTASTDQFITVFSQIAPSPTDVNYPIGKRWVDFVTNKEYILKNFYSENSVVFANWEDLSSGTTATETLTGNSGGPIGADSNNNIFVMGDTSSINIIGDPSQHILTANVILPATANSVLYSDVSSIGGVTPGTSGQFLQCQGSSNPPIWADVPSGGGFSWSSEAANFAANAANGYLVSATSTATLPTTPNNGDTISFVSSIATGSGTITITPAAGQKISVSTVLGTLAGTAVSTAYGDSLTLTYLASSLTWYATSIIGSWTIN